MATTSQVVTSALPSAFETYYTAPSTGLISQAQKLYGAASPADFAAKYVQPLQAAGLYGAGRVAGLSPEQQTVGAQLGAMQTPSQFGVGTAAAQTGAAGLASLLGQQAQTVSPDQLNMYQMGPANQFTGSAVQQYMSPYMQQVVDVQKAQAIRDAQKANLVNNLAAARQGTYGGARNLLTQTEASRNLATQLGNIQATGSQAAYDAARQSFESQRAADLQTAQQNLQAALGVQQLGAGQSLEAQKANQLAALQAQQQRQQASLGLGTLGQELGQLGVAQQAADIDRLKTLGAYGDLTRGIQQQQLDARYADLMQGINYPTSQLENMSAFLRGIPMTDTTTTTTTPPPSFASQLAGLGLSGLSLYNLLGGSKT